MNTHTLQQGQTVHVGGMVRLDLDQTSVDTIYITVWVSPNVSLHLGKTENADEMKNNHAGVRLQPPIGVDRVAELGTWKKKEIKVSGISWDVNSMDVSVAGLGWFSVGFKGNANLTLWTYDGIETTLREPLVLDRAPSIERPGFLLPKAISDALANQGKLEAQAKKGQEDFGTIPDTFLMNSWLMSLNLRGNHFEGEVPRSLINCSNLEFLDLTGLLQLEGVICDEFTGEVIELDLSASRLIGVIHSNSTIFQLSHLRRLNLAYNHLGGSLEFGRLTHLSHLNLSYNDFSGHIPLEILGLEHLTFLDLQSNQLNTSIPHFASNNMKMLKALKLSANKLTTSSVSSILSNLTQLEIIDLSYNPLYKMPPELFELSSLQRINLQQTQLYGPIPKSFSNLVNLKYLNLASNNLSGPIETKTFSNLVNLKYLNLASNNLSGPIIQKRIFSNLVNLEYLSLASNNFTGPIEIDALYNLVNLTSLDLSSNNFGTTLDVKFLSRLKWMWALDLSFSSLALINEDNITLPMISIVYLRLGSCNISDLDILRSIVVQSEVYLPNNKIHGQLPEWIWSKWSNVIELDLSNNFLTHIGNKISLQRLVGLELRSNLLNGQLPILPQSIESLDLSNNQFHGEIKPSICELELYVLLDLSNNSLNGALPHL
ncbi:hypothetical protein Leryth_001778 [Lithospermum erythrorhizon]|nr:hypothetical protein Leryth_001778 [Lithospermum erythrorhizon]